MCPSGTRFLFIGLTPDFVRGYRMPPLRGWSRVGRSASSLWQRRASFISAQSLGAAQANCIGPFDRLRAGSSSGKGRPPQDDRLLLKTRSHVVPPNMGWGPSGSFSDRIGLLEETTGAEISSAMPLPQKGCIFHRNRSNMNYGADSSQFGPVPPSKLPELQFRLCKTT
jgi:hypothetical protein